MKTIIAIVLIIIVGISLWLILFRECADEIQSAEVPYSAIGDLLASLFEKGKHRGYLVFDQPLSEHYIQFYKYKNNLREKVYATYYLKNEATQKFLDNIKEFCEINNFDYEYISYDTLDGNLKTDTRYIDNSDPMYLEIDIHNVTEGMRLFDFLAFQILEFNKDWKFGSHLALCDP